MDFLMFTKWGQCFFLTHDIFWKIKKSWFDWKWSQWITKLTSVFRDLKYFVIKLLEHATLDSLKVDKNICKRNIANEDVFVGEQTLKGFL